MLRPYNISLNPCLDRNLNINRDCNLMGWCTCAPFMTRPTN